MIIPIRTFFCSHDLAGNFTYELPLEVNMSEKLNTDIVQSGYEKFNSGDIEGLLEMLADDVLWQTPEIENARFSGNRQGRVAVAESFKQLSESEQFTRFEPLEFIAQNDKVVVLGEAAATVTSTGSSYETPWVHIFTIRDGKVTEFQEFYDTAVATHAFQKTAAA
jgi:ketosteroid isomerase-like protein